MRQYPLCCGNSKCQTSQTPLWRKGWVNSDGKTIMLCNACGLHYKKGHYCMYCNQIYRESDADDHSNPWIGCDRCSRWVHQKCEEQNGHDCKKQKSYLCPDCRSIGSTDVPATPTIVTTSPSNTSPVAAVAATTTAAVKSSPPSVIKKRRKTPSGSREPDSPITPLTLPLNRLTQFSPMTPSSPISPGSNFLLYSQRQQSASTPSTPTSIFDPNANVMPCWSQLKSSIQNLPPAFPASPSTPSTPTGTKKRKTASLDGTKKQKKSRTTTISSSITTTTTHRVNTAGIDALMGAVLADQNQSEDIPQLDLKISTSARKSKQTPRKMNADARTAAIALSTDTPTTPTTLFSPSLFATTTTTTTTTTVVPRVEEIIKSNVSLSEEQFYKYQQLIMQQKNSNNNNNHHHDGVDGELSNDSISSATSSSSLKQPVTLQLPNTFGSVDTLGNFYGSFNEQNQQQQQNDNGVKTSPYGAMDDDEEEDFSSLDQQRRPQKRLRRPSPKKVTTTTTLTMTTTVSSAKSKRLRERMAKNGGVRKVYASSSETEDSDYDHQGRVVDQQAADSDEETKSTTITWSEAAKELNVSIEDAYDVLTSRFPQAPVLKKMGSLWAICEIIRGQNPVSEV